MYFLNVADAFVLLESLVSVSHKTQFFQHVYTQSKKGCTDQESIQSSTTPVPGYQWESDKLTVRQITREPRVNPFPAGDHKAHINRRAQRHSKHKTENLKDPQKKYCLGTVSKLFYWNSLTSFMAPTSPLIQM